LSALKEALSLGPEAICLPPSWHSDSPEGAVANTGTAVASRLTDEAERSIQHLQQRLSMTSPGDQEYNQCLSEIWKAYNTKISHTNDTTDIEEAIKYFRSLLDQTPLGNASSARMATFLGYFHGCLFQRTQKLEDFVESTDLLRSVLKVPAGQEFAEVVGGMVTSLLVYRLHSAHSDPDKDEANQAIDDYFHLITDNIYTPVPRRLVFACLWAQWSRGTGLPSVSTAYDKAMSLLQESVMFAPVLQIQHAYLVSMLSVAKELPLDYASYLVHTDQVEQAIETLERGRALFWSELRGFRTSIDQLSMVDLLLAERFTAINQDLERLTMSPLPNSGTEVTDIETTYREGVDPFGRVLLRQRKLLEERDRAISQVQTLPGFENFLSTLSFDTLRSAASHGPVIIINHSKWRSDILIILYDSPPSLVLTSEGFYDHAIRLRDKLTDARKNSCLDSKSYGRALASVLADLYELVGQPVINRLRELKIPEQSRVWWCPTSVFCSLPLHAMGPIPTDDGVKRYFFDLFIPSYTPTISALVEARKTDSGPSKQPSLLLVAQPLPGVKEEIEVVQGLDIQVEGLLLEDATTAAVVEGLGRHRLVHFACHGNIERGKPFDASFRLHGGESLTLLDIVHSRLPTAEFALLSACHTAELTEGSIADEGLHLTAALQYCGFRSVVGTMWEMADTDGHDLARHFYRFLFSKKNGDAPHYERSAKALRDAVRKLRSTKGVTLERWVNFVHYGA
jgi:tetratricopeptide (TPR) repeat protein